MAITQNSDRQYPLQAIVDFGFADLTQSVAELAMSLPSDAIVTGGHLYISEVFNSTTTDTIAIGDSAGGAYLAATNVRALGATALVADGSKIAGGGESITLTHVGGVAATATTGAGQLVVEYVRQGRSNENEG